MASFNSTEEMFAVLKPEEDGTYTCPECGKKGHTKRSLGQHTAKTHGIRSAKHKEIDERKSSDIPLTHRAKSVEPKSPPKIVRFCPHCGFPLGDLEEAAQLLTKVR